MFGRKKKEKEIKPEEHNHKKRLEILNKNIDLDKLISKIEEFLKKLDDPFDYATYTIEEFPEEEIKIVKIEYGMKSPTSRFFVILKGNNDDLSISDHLPTNYGAYAEMLGIGVMFGLPKLFNAKAFHSKLWKKIEELVAELEK